MTPTATRSDRSRAGPGGRRRTRVRAAVSPLAALVLALNPAVVPLAAQARILSEVDLATVARIKPLFAEVLTDVSQTAERPNLAAGDSECIRSTMRSLLQISEELRSYEYLITIEGQLNDSVDDGALRGVLRFAVENALKILGTERRRLGDLSEQCSRYALAAGKTRQALQFIEDAEAILKAVQPRL
ncbi:hypothetical protein GMJLKIPL_2433 [Methylobacterium isbiliense]|uniref:NarX-like N-terminal domain-containing protein n=1 Tax=Methylobacterium isbiliense TaxID=315478 RepID=A0ABQ4SDN8_9HYPH|nr:hypothetical protein GMJLKIPL_2433 [Methylobacterium isbiliense]